MLDEVVLGPYDALVLRDGSHHRLVLQNKHSEPKSLGLRDSVLTHDAEVLDVLAPALPHGVRQCYLSVSVEKRGNELWAV